MFVDRFRYQATKAAQVQSRIKLLDKVVPIEVPPERKRMHFTFPAAPKSGRTVLELKHVRKAYGPLVVFDDLSAAHRARRPHRARRAERRRQVHADAHAVGRRSAGPAASGIEGHQVVTRVLRAGRGDAAQSGDTVYETLVGGSPVHMVPAIRNILGGFLFSGDDIYKKCGVLSGGERTRLAVARMLLRPSNLLLLDEPTNHLDLDSKDVLLDALVDYGGTLIFVSHDRYFVERLATRAICSNEEQNNASGDRALPVRAGEEHPGHAEHGRVPVARVHRSAASRARSRPRQYADEVR